MAESKKVKDEVEKEEVKVNAPLQDIVEMVQERPDLTQEEWEIVKKAEGWYKAQLKIDVRAELEVEYAKKYEAGLDELKRINKQTIDEQFAAIKKAQEPMGKEDLDKLLSQEYLEFPCVLKVSKEGETQKVVKHFTICELPSAVEEKFYKLLKKALVPILQERENIAFRLDKASLVEKIQIVLEASEAALDIGGELVAVILDPWEEDKTINKSWVRKNLSTQRQAAIILAQFEANKYRDFFSQGFRGFLNLR